ncbi:hypothetical protein Micbo1qcDRAFT_180847 [Microdochium bolleyi]|uniref:Zn(2)-C6 fungal-type domain-containing protein n=1 Tax=Microdochium bolleyi TaxID=196109 RepID=A0A136IKC4_9PEZI|nr:hypothetical protein Micbo1qcDRAFT_180847 [Microdochium bolleyi]
MRNHDLIAAEKDLVDTQMPAHAPEDFLLLGGKASYTTRRYAESSSLLLSFSPSFFLTQHSQRLSSKDVSALSEGLQERQRFLSRTPDRIVMAYNSMQNGRSQQLHKEPSTEVTKPFTQASVDTSAPAPRNSLPISLLVNVDTQTGPLGGPAVEAHHPTQSPETFPHHYSRVNINTAAQSPPRLEESVPLGEAWPAVGSAEAGRRTITARTSPKPRGSAKQPRKGAACVRCCVLKTRCDNVESACTNCLKAGYLCERADKISKLGWIIYARELEDKVKDLEQQLAQNQTQTSPTSGRGDNQGLASTIVSFPASTQINPSEQPLTHNVGLGSSTPLREQGNENSTASFDPTSRGRMFDSLKDVPGFLEESLQSRQRDSVSIGQRQLSENYHQPSRYSKNYRRSSNIVAHARLLMGSVYRGISNAKACAFMLYLQDLTVALVSTGAALVRWMWSGRDEDDQLPSHASRLVQRQNQVMYNRNSSSIRTRQHQSSPIASITLPAPLYNVPLEAV